MAVRGDDVATSIESHVREAIEKMVGEIRSSVEDVREVVDQQLKAALQSAQADVNAITFLPHIKKSIAELEESLKPKKGAGGADASRVKTAVQAVEQGKSQVDILNALLEQAVQFGSRAALLILRGETFSGWKGLGFSAHGGNDENVKRFNAAPGLIPELDRVLRYEHVVIWDGNNLSSRLGVSGSTKAALIPMVIKDKVAAAVYVDATRDDVVRSVLAETGGEGADVVCEMSGVPSALHQAFAAVRLGGRVQLLGIPDGQVPVDVANEIIFKGITVYGVIGRKMYETWNQMRRYLSAGLVDPRPVITHQFPLAKIDEAIAAIRSGDAGKIILEIA